MKGLWKKDWIHMLDQWKIYIAVIAVSAVAIFTQFSSVLSSLVLFLVLFMAIETIERDREENGMSYMMTMPCSISEYVSQKYAFVFLAVMSLGAIIYGVLYGIGLVYNGGFSTDIFAYTVNGDINMILRLATVVIPVALIFGSKKLPLIIILVIMIANMILAVGQSYFTPVLGMYNSDNIIDQIILWYDRLSQIGRYGIQYLITFVMWCVSYCISLGVMNKREF